MARARREVVVAFLGKDELTGEIQKLRNELGQVKTVGGVAAAGLPAVGQAGVPVVGGFGPTAQQVALSGTGFPGALSDPFGLLSAGLSGAGSFLTSPILSFGGPTSFVGGGVAGGIQGGATFGGLGVSALGALGAGLTGVGLGTALFPQGGIGPMIGGALGGIGGLIGGAALGSALGVVAGTALATIIPGVGAILGAVAGSFLGNLFGGGREKRKQQSLQTSDAAHRVVASFSGAAESWAQTHPLLGAALLDALNGLGTYRTTTQSHSASQLSIAQQLASLFANGRIPSPDEIYLVLATRAATPPWMTQPHIRVIGLG
ncbi:MAG: hypothetical protein ACRDHY_18720, partial [Anaerolineales bacterium]